jgi:hypothetical protein
MRNNIAIGALIVVVGVLLYFLLRDGKQYDSHTTDNDMVKADNKIILAQRDAGLKKIDSFERDAKRRDTLESNLKAQLSGTRRDLDKSVASAVRLAKEINLMKDTARMAGWGDEEWAIVRRSTLDSLTNELPNLVFLYQQYKDYADSLTAVVDSNKVGYQFALTEQKKLYDNLYNKYEQLYRLYEQLFKDYTGARKSLKREKLKTKVAALLALVAGGAAVIGVR